MNALFASVDLGGTNLHVALGHVSGGVVAELRVATHSHEGPAAVLARTARTIEQLAAETGQRPVSVGVGVPGLVDTASGVTKFLPNLPTNWREVPVAAQLEASLGCPVRVLNDARAATLGELVYGLGHGVQSMLYFGLGTGVGGGVVLGGKLVLGPLGAAGELGHQTVQPDGPLCGCGNRGCLEAFASGPALAGEGVRLMLAGNAPHLRELVRDKAQEITPFTMAEAARLGDGAVCEAFARAGRWLGIGVANLVTALHPGLVVVGGGVAEAGDLILEPMRATVRERVRMFPVDDLRMERSALNDRAGLLGGIALASRCSDGMTAFTL